MSAVFEAVDNLVEDVVDVVGDAVEWVGDTVSNVVEDAMDDPLKAIVQVAAVATGNAWALPVIAGADVLQEGGSLGDALQAAALSYAGKVAFGYVTDSFGAIGDTTGAGSGVTQIFDDGSSVQFFDDGSTIATATDGAITSTPAYDPAVDQAAADAAMAQSPGVETFPVPGPGAITATELPPPTAQQPDTTAISPANIPLAESPPPVGLQSLVEPPPAVQTAVVPPGGAEPLQTTLPPVDYVPPATQIFDDGSSVQNFDDGSTIAKATDGTLTSTPAYDPDLGKAVSDVPLARTVDERYAQGELTDAQYKEITGKAPVVDRSQPAVDFPKTSLTDAAWDLGKSAVEYAKTHPLPTAAVIGGGLALAGAFGQESTEPTADATTPTKKTYTYGQAAPINATGLQELWGAASKIYGEGNVMKQLGIEAPKFESSFKPLLVGQSPGLGSLQRGYQPMGAPQAFDISTLSPEQIIQLQDMVKRQRG